MPIITDRAASTRSRKPRTADILHLLIYSLYGVAGIAAGMSVYSRILTVVGDAMASAILTLLFAIMFISAVTRETRRQ